MLCFTSTLTIRCRRLGRLQRYRISFYASLREVQFDACIGYPSITANYTPEWKKWWFDQKNVNLYQFMGKDNVYFHTIYFPSVQIGDGRPWTKLHHLSTTG